MKNMASVLALTLGFSTALCATATTSYGTDMEQKDAQVSVGENANPELLGPHWNVGDEWIVETETRSEQRSKGNEREVVWSKPIRWKFRVEAVEKNDDETLFRTTIVCLEENPINPKLAIWLDGDSGALVRLESTLTFAGKETTFVETYVGKDGYSPVIGTIPAIPLDMPLFNSQKRLDGKKKQAYSIFQGRQTKSGNDVVFLRRIEQTTNPEPETEAQSGAGVRVMLKSGSDYAIQIWNPGKPWASFGDNGTTRFRLIEDAK